jgi:hypothetical protein
MSDKIEKSQIKLAAEKLGNKTEADQLAKKYDVVVKAIDDGLLEGADVQETKKQLDELANSIVEESLLMEVSSQGDEVLRNNFLMLNEKLDEILAEEDISSFAKIDNLLEGLGIEVEIDFYVSSYSRVNESLKVPHKEILDQLEELTQMGIKDLASDDARQIRLSLAHFVNGRYLDGTNVLNKLKQKFELYPFAKSAKEGLGLESLSVEKVASLFVVLEEKGVSNDRSMAILSNLSQQYSASLENLGLKPDELCQYLLSTVLDAERFGDDYDDFLEDEYYVVSKLRTESEAIQADLEKKQEKFSEASRQLSLYAIENRGLKFNKKTAELKLQLAQASHERKSSARDALYLQAKHSIAIEYSASVKGAMPKEMRQTNLDEILLANGDSYDDLKAAAENLGLNVSAILLPLQMAENDLAIANIELQRSEFQNTTRVLDEHDNTVLQPFASYKAFNDGAPFGTLGERVLGFQIQREREQLMEIKDRMSGQIAVEQSGFIKDTLANFQNIGLVPEVYRGQIGSRVQNYINLCKQYQSVLGKIYGNTGDAQILNDDLNIDNELSQELIDVDSNVELAESFLGGEHQKVNLAEIGDSPLNDMVISRTLAPYRNTIANELDKTVASFKPMEGHNKSFENFAKNPELWKKHGENQFTIFDSCLSDFDKCIFQIGSARKSVEDQISSLKNSLGQNPSMKESMKIAINDQIASFDLILSSPNSRLSDFYLKRAEEGLKAMQEAKDNLVNGVLWTTAIITVAAIAGAFAVSGVFLSAMSLGVRAGVSAAELAGYFGAAEGGSAMLGAAASAKFLTSITLTSVGATLGSRGGMMITDKLEWSDFGEKIWDPWLFTRDVGIGMLASGSSLLAIRGLQYGQYARWGAISSLSARGLEAFKSLGAVTSISSSFEGASIGVASTGVNALKQLGVRLFGEYSEETLENALQNVPVLGWLVQTANSMDGINVESGNIGVSARKVGIAFEGGRPVYKGGDPEAFLAKLETEVNLRPGRDFHAEIDANGDITLDVIGPNLHQSVAQFVISKADPESISFAASTADIPGITNEADGSLGVQTADALQGLKIKLGQNGFALKYNEAGDLVAAIAPDNSVLTLSVDPSVVETTPTISPESTRNSYSLVKAKEVLRAIPGKMGEQMMAALDYLAVKVPEAALRIAMVIAMPGVANAKTKQIVDNRGFGETMMDGLQDGASAVWNTIVGGAEVSVDFVGHSAEYGIYGLLTYYGLKLAGFAYGPITKLLIRKSAITNTKKYFQRRSEAASKLGQDVKASFGQNLAGVDNALNVLDVEPGIKNWFKSKLPFLSPDTTALNVKDDLPKMLAVLDGMDAKIKAKLDGLSNKREYAPIAKAVRNSYLNFSKSVRKFLKLASDPRVKKSKVEKAYKEVMERQVQLEASVDSVDPDGAWLLSPETKEFIDAAPKLGGGLVAIMWFYGLFHLDEEEEGHGSFVELPSSINNPEKAYENGIADIIAKFELKSVAVKTEGGTVMVDYFSTKHPETLFNVYAFRAAIFKENLKRVHVELQKYSLELENYRSQIEKLKSIVKSREDGYEKTEKDVEKLKKEIAYKKKQHRDNANLYPSNSRKQEAEDAIAKMEAELNSKVSAGLDYSIEIVDISEPSKGKQKFKDVRKLLNKYLDKADELESKSNEYSEKAEYSQSQIILGEEGNAEYLKYLEWLRDNVKGNEAVPEDEGEMLEIPEELLMAGSTSSHTKPTRWERSKDTKPAPEKTKEIPATENTPPVVPAKKPEATPKKQATPEQLEILRKVREHNSQ